MMYRYFEKDALLPVYRRIGLRTRLRGRGVGIAFIDSGFCPHPDLTWPNRVLAHRDFTGSSVDLFGPPEVLSWHGLQTSVVGAGNGALSRGRYRSCAPESQVALLKVKNDGRIRRECLIAALAWILKEGRDLGIRVAVFAVALDADADPNGLVSQAVDEIGKAGVLVVAAAGNTDGLSLLPPASAAGALTVGGYVDDNSSARARFQRYPGPRENGKPELLAPAAYIPTPLHPQHPLFVQARVAWQLMEMPDRELLRAFPRAYGLFSFPQNTRRLRAAAIRDLIRTRIYTEKLVSDAYQHGDGTSFAAPIVASVAACMLEGNPNLAPADIRAILTGTAEHLPGIGPALSAQRAVDAASGTAAAARK